MSCCKAVIGLGFGDEGKGRVIDWLVGQTPPNPLKYVVRFNGGHQAGHTVVRNGKRHIFSQVGSGGLQGVKTYYSPYCTLDPQALKNELKVLESQHNIKPEIYIDERCPVVTPYEIWSNRRDDKNLRHGSTGCGFGKTIEREEQGYSLVALDLQYPDILTERITLLEQNLYQWCVPAKISHWQRCCQELLALPNVHITYGLQETVEEVYFEGAQGLLLDPYTGFFPHVTRSNTGLENIQELVAELPELYFVTRAYQTRHGNGFMTNEDLNLELRNTEDETNKYNGYQGGFRKSILDVSLLEYALKKSGLLKYAVESTLVINCVDQLEEYKFTYAGQVLTCANAYEFAERIAYFLEFGKVFIGISPESNHLEPVTLQVKL